MFAHTFNRRAATCIGAVSLVLAILASLAAWFAAQESAEEATVALAIEESQRLLRHFDALHMDTETSRAQAATAAQAIVGGLFDITEIYDAAGRWALRVFALLASLEEPGKGFFYGVRVIRA